MPSTLLPDQAFPKDMRGRSFLAAATHWRLTVRDRNRWTFENGIGPQLVVLQFGA
jgi:hypothetical protein